MKQLFRSLNYTFLFVVVLFLMSVSCTETDDQTNDDIKENTVIDIDGNIYHVDTIGDQIWMRENLKTTRFRDGSPIPKVLQNNDWAALESAAYCNCNNDQSLVSKYGRLYNWYAVNDIRNIAPEGWHVATDEDWIILEKYVSGFYGVGDSVAKPLAAKTDWNESDSLSAVGNDLTKNNISGFTALPGGNRLRDGNWGFHGYEAYWWTASKNSDYNAIGKSLKFDSHNLKNGSFGYQSGMSIRCVKD
jgi:uncharacterized protein (TIGR02145 family)